MAQGKHSPGLEEKPKEGVKIENNDHTNLKVAGMDGSLVHFKIKRHTALSKLMKPIVNDRLKMKDEDAIDVFQQQIGGVYSKGNLLLYCRTLFLLNIKTCSQLENPI
ncbi:small ubiquitin-related modifier 2-like [Physeter macrocephalus]|uniref:Small ubiquitin-related modifier 2-like n=1 Tax=Physeter macrocephalus TaxID=9755 RepID=A0A2Y9EFW6_PHYMC|nr:small ubiquitin-related modifier 2-like [Physeter catodon]|eukprot:XP_007101498.1 small ubiquitin-related modifier 2-like [Physeter catodon]